MSTLREEFEAWKRTMDSGYEAWQAVEWATERAARKCLDLKPPNLDHTPGEYHRFDITTLACAAAIRGDGSSHG